MHGSVYTQKQPDKPLTIEHQGNSSHGDVVKVLILQCNTLSFLCTNAKSQAKEQSLQYRAKRVLT